MTKFLRPQSGMGAGRIDWPDEREHRLGAQLALLSQFADGRVEGWNFAHDYFDASSRNVDEILNAMTQGLIQPMLDELERYLRRNLDKPVPKIGSLTVPASDRVVGLDHNSAGYTGTVSALDALEAAVVASNSIADPDKERVVSELGASQRLLKSRTVRIAAIGAVLVPALTWLVDITAGTAVGLAVEALIEQLKLLLPMLFS